MEFALRGDADGGPALDLDHEAFSYAGKFVMTNTGKAVAEEDGELIAALSFNRDRTDDTLGWIRYVTVREDRRAEGVGSRLAAYTAETLLDEFDRVRIAVNNPFAYEALYKAGFGYTGERTGLAEVVLERPVDCVTSTYQEGLHTFRDRDLTDAEESFIDEKAKGDPPPVVILS